MRNWQGTNLKLLREENLGLAARGIFRKDLLWYRDLKDSEEQRREEKNRLWTRETHKGLWRKTYVEKNYNKYIRTTGMNEWPSWQNSTLSRSEFYMMVLIKISWATVTLRTTAPSTYIILYARTVQLLETDKRLLSCMWKRASCCLATWWRGWGGGEAQQEGPEAARVYLSFLRSPAGTGLTEILGRVEMELWDWLEANEDVSRLRGDRGGVMRQGLLHSEWDRDPDEQHRNNRQHGL